MALTTIHSFGTSTDVDNTPKWRQLVWCTDQVAYLFLAQGGNTRPQMVYIKTLDGGATWSSPVHLGLDNGTEKMTGLAIWYDRWTQLGDTGTKIHLFFAHTPDGGSSNRFPKYRSLDTAGDILSSIVQISSNDVSGGANGFAATIVKARSGRLYAIGYVTSGASAASHYSDDNGNTWTQMGDAAGFLTGYNFGFSHIMATPGNETDDDDIWVFQHEVITVLRVRMGHYDATADNFVIQNILTVSASPNTSNVSEEMHVMTRHSDNNAILLFPDDNIASPVSIRVWDIAGTASITAKTNVVTDVDSIAFVRGHIDQPNADIYVAYLDLSDGFTKYSSSDDGGATWASATSITGTDSIAESLVTLGEMCTLDGSIINPIWVNASNEYEYDPDFDIDCPTGPTSTIGVAGPGGGPNDPFYVDSGLSYIGPAADVITNLDHLEGETVQVNADGLRQADKVVSSGQITLDTAGMKVHIGLGYTSTLIPMPIVPQNTQFDPRLAQVRIARAMMDLDKALGGTVDGDPIPDMDATVDSLFTGVNEMTVDTRFSRRESLTILHVDPVPFNILSLMMEIEVDADT